MTYKSAVDVGEVLWTRPELASLSPGELGHLLGCDPKVAGAGIAWLAYRAAGVFDRDDQYDTRDDLSLDDLLVLLGRPVFVDSPETGALEMDTRTVYVPLASTLEHALALLPELQRTHWVRYWRETNGIGVGMEAPRREARGPLSIQIDHGAGDLFGDVLGGAVDETLGAATDTLPDTGPDIGPIDPAYGTYGTGGGSGTMAKNPSRPWGTPGLYRTSPTFQWVLNILSGWSPRAYSSAITGDENRARELIDLNAATYGTTGTPGTVGYNLAKFRVGDPLMIPKGWNQYVSSEGDWGTKGKAWPEAPTGATSTTPPPTTGTTSSSTYAATLPDGTIAALKVQLGALAAKYPAMGVVGYPGTWDVNDVIDEAFRGALSKFQAWSNANRSTLTGSPPVLRTDGVLDEPTHAMLNAWTAYSVPKGTDTVPVSTPTAPTGTDLFGTGGSWPSPIPGATGPAGPDKGLTTSPAPGSIKGSNQLGETSATNSGGGGGGGLAAAAVIAYLAMKGL